MYDLQVWYILYTWIVRVRGPHNTRCRFQVNNRAFPQLNKRSYIRIVVTTHFCSARSILSNGKNEKPSMDSSVGRAHWALFLFVVLYLGLWHRIYVIESTAKVIWIRLYTFRLYATYLRSVLSTLYFRTFKLLVLKNSDYLWYKIRFRYFVLRCIVHHKKYVCSYEQTLCNHF